MRADCSVATEAAFVASEATRAANLSASVSPPSLAILTVSSLRMNAVCAPFSAPSKEISVAITPSCAMRADCSVLIEAALVESVEARLEKRAEKVSPASLSILTVAVSIMNAVCAPFCAPIRARREANAVSSVERAVASVTTAAALSLTSVCSTEISATAWPIRGSSRESHVVMLTS